MSSIDTFEYFPPTEDSSEDDDDDLYNGGAAGGLSPGKGAVGGVGRSKRKGGKVKVVSRSDKIVEIDDDDDEDKNDKEPDRKGKGGNKFNLLTISIYTSP